MGRGEVSRRCDAAALAPRAGRALSGAGRPRTGAGPGIRDGTGMARIDGKSGETSSLPSGPYVDWYEAWLAQHGKRSVAEAAARARAERQVRLIVRLFVGWAAVVTAATFASIWWVM